MRNESDTEPAPQYLFIVARNRPDILERVKERLRGDGRIDVITDRRRGERRAVREARTPERRRGDRRRPTRHWDDLTVYPTLVVQNRMHGLETREGSVRADNERLRGELAALQQRLHALAAADATFKADASAILGQAEAAVGALIARFEALTRERGIEIPSSPRG